MKFKITMILLLMTNLTGCVSFPDTVTSLSNMYNVASSGSSQFDGTKYIRVSNMQCGSVMFELYQDTLKSKNGIVLLNAGARGIENIGNGESLLIKLDGKTYTFTPVDNITEHESIHMGYGVAMDFSHKTYLLPESFVREAAASSIFLTKMIFLNNKFIEGECTADTLEEAELKGKELGLEITQEHLDMGNKFVAIIGFQKFVQMMDATTW